jgi:type I restriction enzyme, S subunit
VSETATVPMLRFSEFTGGWKSVSFSSLCELKGRIGYRGYTVADIVAEDSGVIALSPSNINSSGDFQHKNDTYISWFKYEESPEIMVENGHILLVKTGSTYGKAALIEGFGEKATVNPQVVVIKPRNTNSRFLYSIVIGSRFQKQIHETVVGGALPTLSQASVLNYSVNTCTLLEQQKIADFLGAVDARVGLLRRRRDALRAYKKGMMQRLFSQELRFTKPDGSPFPDWQEKRLGEVSETVTGSSNREDSTEQGDYVFFDRSSDVRASARFLFDCEAIIVAGEGKDFPPRHFVGKFDLHQRTYATMNFGNNSGRFLFYWIDWHRAHFLKHSVGSTMPSLRMGSFSHFPVSLPHPEEQQKIADTLTALDAKIDAVTAQMDAMLRFKKGLLQQMFV